jgi:hypothetical protein
MKVLDTTKGVGLECAKVSSQTKVSVRRDWHSEKSLSSGVPADDGMQIHESDRERENLLLSILERRRTDTEATFQKDRPPAKNHSQNVSTVTGRQMRLIGITARTNMITWERPFLTTVRA